MDIEEPDLVPSREYDREHMVQLQDRVRDLATFTDDHPRVSIGPTSVVGGADLAFAGDVAVAAVVAMCDGEIIEQHTVRQSVHIPYIPGLLAFREAAPMLEAITRLDIDLDLLLIDGNGRIHPREAGLATHVGVTLDAPTVGVAKGLLCGRLDDPPPTPFAAGTQCPIIADDSMVGATARTVGYAVQTRQWADSTRSINPVYVSPGHRVSAETAAECVLSCVSEYKLPDPIREADRLAGECASEG